MKLQTATFANYYSLLLFLRAYGLKLNILIKHILICVLPEIITCMHLVPSPILFLS